MRPGCDRPAVSRLSYDTISCQVWLDPVPERPGPAQEICELHTSRLTVPRGWVLCDRRGDAPALFVPPVEPETRTNGTARNGSSKRAANGEERTPRRRVRTAPAPALFESPVEADDSGPEQPRTTPRNGSSSRKERRVAATVPVSVEPVETVVETVVTETEVTETVVTETEVTETVVTEATPSPAEAQEVEEVEDLPTSPLLARAFRATGPQRSVLTQTLLNDAD